MRVSWLLEWKSTISPGAADTESKCQLSSDTPPSHLNTFKTPRRDNGLSLNLAKISMLNMITKYEIPSRETNSFAMSSKVFIVHHTIPDFASSAKLGHDHIESFCVFALE